MPLISALTQEAEAGDLSEFEDSLVYRVSSKIAKGCRKTVSKIPKPKPNQNKNPVIIIRQRELEKWLNK